MISRETGPRGEAYDARTEALGSGLDFELYEEEIGSQYGNSSAGGLFSDVWSSIGQLNGEWALLHGIIGTGERRDGLSHAKSLRREDGIHHVVPNSVCHCLLVGCVRRRETFHSAHRRMPGSLSSTETWSGVVVCRRRWLRRRHSPFLTHQYSGRLPLWFTAGSGGGVLERGSQVGLAVQAAG